MTSNSATTISAVVGHQPIGENAERGIGGHSCQGFVENFLEIRVQGGLPSHEIYDGSVADFGEHLMEEKIQFHGLARRSYRFLHVLIGKTVITF